MRNLLFPALGLGLVLLGVVLDRRQAAEHDQIRADIAQLADALHAQQAAPARDLGAAAPRAEVQHLSRAVAQLDQRIGAAQRSDAQAAPSDEPPEGPTPEQTAALDASQSIVDAVIRSGRLRVEDVIELRKLQDAAGPEFRKIRRQLIVAINRQQLVPPDDPAFVLP
ncbi:hypothetical protein WME94_20570 [Sorangium sp. So ce429]